MSLVNLPEGFLIDHARDYLGSEVTLRAHRDARYAPQHHDLPDVCQSVTDGALNQLLNRAGQRRTRLQICIQPLRGGEESRHFLAPRQGRGH